MAFGDELLNSFTATVGAGNYSYYKLKFPGEITLILTSVQGDADLYVSENEAEPDFENYDLKSATCGVDMTTVPTSYNRPTYIGVYGHIHSPISDYRLTAILNYTESAGNVDNFNEENYTEGDKENLMGVGRFIWDLFVLICKILLEVLLWHCVVMKSFLIMFCICRICKF